MIDRLINELKCARGLPKLIMMLSKEIERPEIGSRRLLAGC